MKTQVKRYGTKWVALFLMMFLSIMVAQNSYATCPHVPVAICSTGGTTIPLPNYVCCQLRDNKGLPIWQNTWVPTCCKNANPRAVYDMGCRTNSPVYGMGSSILGNCQFSYSTCRYL